MHADGMKLLTNGFFKQNLESVTERFSIKRHKIKTTVNTLANNNKRKRIRIRSKFM